MTGPLQATGAPGPAAPPRNAGFSTLRGLATPRRAIERCEVCAKMLAPEHQHLFAPQVRQVICVCGECAVSVGGREANGFLRVPDLVRALPDFAMTEQQWDDLLIPVGMAFFSYSTPQGRVVANYPGAAGVLQAELEPEAWAALVANNSELAALRHDVEALLVNRVSAAHEYFVVPIDRCYLLAGLIRMRWRGLSGGTEVWKAIGDFFDGLRAQARRNGGRGDA